MPIGYQKRIETLEQSQLENIVRYYLMIEQKTDITLTAGTVIDSDAIQVSEGHGFTGVDGETICLWDGMYFVQHRVISVVDNTIYTGIPLCRIFSQETTQVVRGNINLNKDCSLSSEKATFFLHNEPIPIDITQVNISATHSLAGDDGKFLGIDKLTKGLLFRRLDGILENFGNYRDNATFKLYGYDVVYAAKGPSGIESTFCALNLKNVYGKEIRLKQNDEFFALLQENFSALTSFRIAILGSYTQGE